MDVNIFSTVSSLDSIADEWDALCGMSGVTLPTARAGLIRIWLEHFAPRQPFHAVTVRQGDRLVGALPLVEQSWQRLLRWGTLPVNHWARHGTLLIDPEVSVTAVATQIASALSRLPWRVLLFPAVWLDDPHWLALGDACRAAGWCVLESPLYSAGLMHIDRSWTDLQRSWTRNRRRNYKRHLRRAEQEGEIALEVCEEVGPEQASALLREGFEIEHRSWKGANRTSVLSLPEMHAFFQAQARELAKSHCLRFAFLLLKGRRIAFEYHWLVNGTLFTPKIAYDEAYAHISPGKVLEYLHYRALYEEQRITMVDFLGPCPAGREHWANVCHPVGSHLITRPGVSSSVFASAYRLRRRLKRMWKRSHDKRGPVECDATGASDGCPRKATCD